MGGFRTVLALAMALAARAGWPEVPLGPEFPVDTLPGFPGAPAVAFDPDGGFVVAWHSAASPGGERDVRARRFDTAGLPLDAQEFQVNTYTSAHQQGASVAPTADGFMVVWQSDGQDGSEPGIFGRRYGRDGVALTPEFPVNAHTTMHQFYPTIAARSNGEIVAVWKSYRQFGSHLDVIGRHYDAAGAPAGSEFPVSTATDSSHQYPEVAASADGGFVVVYYRFDPSFSQADVFAQLFDPTGARVGGEIAVNTYTTGTQLDSAVAMQPDGGFLVVWENNADVMARRFDAAGLPAGDEFRVNTYTTGGQGFRPKVASDPAGSFVVVWHSDQLPGSDLHVFGQRLDATGAPLGGEFRIGSSTSGQSGPRVATGADGTFVVVWAVFPGAGVRGQRFGPDAIFRDGFESGFALW
jgi:hypothetical protein